MFKNFKFGLAQKNMNYYLYQETTGNTLLSRNVQNTVLRLSEIVNIVFLLKQM